MQTLATALQTPFAPMRAAVARVRDLSPSFRRITLSGPELASVADNRFDQRFKLLLPGPGVELAGFEGNADWYEHWRSLPEAARPVMRTYTLREVRPELGEFDVDIALHGRIGPASAWAIDAVPGDEVVVIVPNANYTEGSHGGVDFLPPAHAERLLIAGDETALPAISGIFERLGPDARGIAVIEVPHAADAAALSPAPAGIEVRIRERGARLVGCELTEQVKIAARELLELPRLSARQLCANGCAREHCCVDDVDIDGGLLWEVPADEHGRPLLEQAELYSWLAGESAAIKELRRFLVGELGVDRKAVAFMGYWRNGRPAL